MQINRLSEELLLQTKKRENTESLCRKLAALPSNLLVDQLKDEGPKKAFWINCYNAYFLILRREKKMSRPAIFREKVIRIAGHYFSLDDIEHGILRRYRWKWSLGYLPNPFTRRLIKHLAVAKLDYRIHFALNCGAKSCPPIAFYTPEKVEEQLEQATISFLEGESELFPDRKTIKTTRLFLWFRGDFGGKRGIRRMLEESLKIKLRGWSITYNDYDWSEDLGRFFQKNE